MTASEPPRYEVHHIGRREFQVYDRKFDVNIATRASRTAAQRIVDGCNRRNEEGLRRGWITAEASSEEED